MSKSSLVSQKIPVLMAEGKTQKQAVGEAEGMADQGQLRPGGVYVRAPHDGAKSVASRFRRKRKN